MNLLLAVYLDFTFETSHYRGTAPFDVSSNITMTNKMTEDTCRVAFGGEAISLTFSTPHSVRYMG